MSSYDTEQRQPLDSEIVETLGRFKAENTEAFNLAQTIFTILVDPHVAYKEDFCEEDAQFVNGIFTEWVLYDFRLSNGQTLMEEMAEADSSIRQFAETQFYSRFWVVRQDRRRGVATLRDTETLAEYEVWDKHIATTRKWRKGTLGTRIAQVGDIWVTCGQTCLHDNAASKPQKAKGATTTERNQDQWRFLREVEAVIGHNGIYHESLEAPDECA